MAITKARQSMLQTALRATAYVLTAWAGLCTPLVLALNMAAAPMPVVIEAVLATGGLLAFSVGLFGLSGHRRSFLWLFPFLVCLMAIRLTHYGVIDFSGFGFTDEFFLHWGMESTRVAVMEYDRELMIGGLLLAVILATMHPVSQYALNLRPAILGGLCVLGIVSAAAGRGTLPEWQLLQAYKDWRYPLAVLNDTDPKTRNQLIELGLLDIELPYKQQVTATPSSQPKNLIVLYLESVGVNLAAQPQWPDLMPNLAQLLAEHAWVDHLWASGYITIEGLTNTQCGTLVPFNRGSESIADGEGLVDALPCLGDVLSAAGYQQMFLGGAETTFAGKGPFLSRHGFDEVLGLEHWRARGLNSRPNTWGLSDPDLFNESLKAIDQLQAADEPWHLSMLTIGTHLPGYLYEECAPYSGGDERFLDALHCTDQLLGRWVAALEKEGILDDTVVVITADHQVFPNSEMRGLFGEGVYDRRLPMIVLGPSGVSASVNEGSGYDLAPTLLDLLEIKHNAGFILGRSLAGPVDRPAYFLTRYSDFFQGARVVNPPDCDAAQDTPLPLNICQKGEFLSILGLISERFSDPVSRLACGLDYIQTHSVDADLLEIVVGDKDQLDRFIRSGRPIDIARGGWAVLFLDQQGEVFHRAFLPEVQTSAEALSALDVHFDSSSSQILIWTGAGRADELPSFAPPPVTGPHAWWLDSRGDVIAESMPLPDNPNSELKSLSFDRAACMRAVRADALQSGLR